MIENMPQRKVVKLAFLYLLLGAGTLPAFGETIVAATDATPQLSLNSSNDAFYYLDEAITSATPIFSASTYPYPDVFGDTINGYLCTGCYEIDFENDAYSVTDSFIDFTTYQPTTISGYNLELADDGPGGGADPNGGARSVTTFELFADGNLISYANILPFGATYQSVYGAQAIVVSDSFAPITASNWEAVFVSNNFYNLTGPRVIDLQGIPYSAPSASPAPEPGTASIIGLGLVSIALAARCYTRLP